MGENIPVVDLLTEQEAAKVLRVSPQTVARYRKQEGLPAVLLGNKWFYRPEAVANWVLNREVTNNQGAK